MINRHRQRKSQVQMKELLGLNLYKIKKRNLFLTMRMLFDDVS